MKKILHVFRLKAPDDSYYFMLTLVSHGKTLGMLENVTKPKTLTLSLVPSPETFARTKRIEKFLTRHYDTTDLQQIHDQLQPSVEAYHKQYDDLDPQDDTHPLNLMDARHFCLTPPFKYEHSLAHVKLLSGSSEAWSQESRAAYHKQYGKPAKMGRPVSQANQGKLISKTTGRPLKDARYQPTLETVELFEQSCEQREWGYSGVQGRCQIRELFSVAKYHDPVLKKREDPFVLASIYQRCLEIKNRKWYVPPPDLFVERMMRASEPPQDTDYIFFPATRWARFLTEFYQNPGELSKKMLTADNGQLYTHYLDKTGSDAYLEEFGHLIEPPASAGDNGIDAFLYNPDVEIPENLVHFNENSTRDYDAVRI